MKTNELSKAIRLYKEGWRINPWSSLCIDILQRNDTRDWANHKSTSPRIWRLLKTLEKNDI